MVLRYMLIIFDCLFRLFCKIDSDRSRPDRTAKIQQCEKSSAVSVSVDQKQKFALHDAAAATAAAAAVYVHARGVGLLVSLAAFRFDQTE